MRTLSLCLIAVSLTLTGCSLKPKPAPEQEPAKLIEPAAPEKPAHPAPRPRPVKLYQDAEELVGKPFRDLGEVSGSVCQASSQGNAPSLTTARKRMLTKAAGMKANAVLLHQCAVLSDSNGCYRQALCQGSALNVSDQ